MIQYKHYSFDLWLTLIKSNPSFKKERASFFYQEFNDKKKSMEEVELVFRQVNLMCNAINEKTGKNLDADEMYLMVISILNDHDYNIASVDMDDLYKQTEKILFNYLPKVYSENTLETLDKIKQQTAASFNILSNTAFIKGSTLKQVLNELNLSAYFDFQIYSDEIGISKPDKSIFNLMVKNARNIEHNENIALHEFIHVGDNFKADIEGARNIGLQTMQINSNDYTILNLLN